MSATSASAFRPAALARAPARRRDPRARPSGAPRANPHRARGRTTANSFTDDVDDVPQWLDGAPEGAVFLFGFHPSEVTPLASLIGALAEEMEVTAADAMRVAFVSGDALGVSAEALLGEEEPPALDQRPDPDDVRLPPAARCVLLRGDAARALMPDLRFEMYSAGCAPCVFGTFTESNAGQPLGKIAAGLVGAFETYWDLPGDPAERRAGGSIRVNGEGDFTGDGTGDGDVAGTAAATRPPEWATSTSWPGEEDWTPANATVALAVTMDRATVFDPPVSWEAYVDENGDGDGDENGDDAPPVRSDVSAVVSLDGVVGDELRAALLDAATEPGWPHATAESPPTPKWARETNDGIGAEASRDPDGPQLRVPPTSWGLTETALEEIAESAPVRAFLARVGALYPEYHVRTMPADALEPDGIPGAMSAARDGGESRVAVAVANAAVHGDDFKWHLDMDPADLDPTSPFAERYGVYVNRARARPLFVSALVYLNGPAPWTPDLDAETLFLDPGTATGVFVRPAPGRVLLMDQDVLHRVSAPSRSARVPRYSLVLKLCFYPKDPEARPSILRPEWGEPIAFGTAGGRRAPSSATGDEGGRREEEAERDREA